MNIEEAMKIHEDALMMLPNVTGIGIGEKMGAAVIKVFVTQKLPESLLRPSEIVSKTLEGFQTDVDEIGVVTAQLL